MAIEDEEREAEARAAAYAEGERLLAKSNQLAAIGLAIMLGSVLIAAVVRVSETLIILGLAIGVLVAGAGAVIGQSGRAKKDSVMRAEKDSARGGVRSFVLGAILGAMLGAVASQYMPFFGTSGVGALAQPMSPYRISLLWHHVATGAVALGLVAAALSRVTTK